jgi:hypothetical protein
MSLARFVLLIIMTSTVACTVNPLPIPAIDDSYRGADADHISKIDIGVSQDDGFGGGDVLHAPADATELVDISAGDLLQPLDGVPEDGPGEGGPHDGQPADGPTDGGPADAPQE